MIFSSAKPTSGGFSLSYLQVLLCFACFHSEITSYTLKPDDEKVQGIVVAHKAKVSNFMAVHSYVIISR